MVKQPTPKRPAALERFSREVGTQEQRKLRAQRAHSGIWAGLGTLGLVGWSIGAPTLLGAFLGMWIDKRHPGTHSWTLSLLFAGLCLGCANAWHWLTREQRQIHKDEGK
jgi:ATP synthase protein I